MKKKMRVNWMHVTFAVIAVLVVLSMVLSLFAPALQ
jgi:hypothetical protein